eukprot:GHRR01037063.1.p1 GENE.GHRR01037063.1~~GHRR01037063.1.p1  ORF type:complete len:139 (-),score=14.09 GHRR01037063.1:195-611(-)
MQLDKATKYWLSTSPSHQVCSEQVPCLGICCACSIQCKVGPVIQTEHAFFILCMCSWGAKAAYRPARDDAHITPVVSKSSANFIQALVEDARAKGTQVLTKFKRYSMSAKLYNACLVDPKCYEALVQLKGGNGKPIVL